MVSVSGFYTKEEIIKTRKQAETSEARFRNYIQNSPTSVFLVDQKGRYTFVNNSACNLLGYSESELLQMSINDLLVSGVPNDENGDFKELKQTEIIQNFEKKIIRKNSQVIDVILDGKKLSENEYIAFVKDITGRKQTEASLLKSEERFALVVYASEQGIWDWNVETNEIYFSPQWKNQIGYSDYEIIIEYIYKFYKPEVENKGLKFLFTNRMPAKEVIINTDNEKVYTILTNLIKNAIKFNYEGSIEFGDVIKPDCEPDYTEQSRNAELEFFVKNTGTGIPEIMRQWFRFINM